MEIVTKKYLRKPLYVDAVQVTEENFEDLAKWCQAEIKNNDGSPLATDVTKRINPGGQHIKVRVHNPRNPRQTKAFIGDWILYTDRGYKIYTKKTFDAAFDPVEEQPVVETPQDEAAA